MASAAFTFLRSSPVRWAAGGWLFFIAENLILSENRTYLIDQLGDTGYHNVYGAFSTAAVGSIGYAYWKKIRHVGPFVPVTMTSRIISFAMLSVGLGMASQTLPKFQIPITYAPSTSTSTTIASSDNTETLSSEQKTTAATMGPSVPPPSTPKSSFKVQCPFDFADPKKSMDGQQPYGLERISRHPGLWSMGLVGIGHALLVPSLPQRIWLRMPVLVALIGGSHTDSRYRRSMGGTLDPAYDAQTSNIPFAAMITTNITNAATSTSTTTEEEAEGQGQLSKLMKELKPLNAMLAVSVAAAWAFRRGAGPVPAAIRQAAVDAVKR